MAACSERASLSELELPREFEDLSGLLESDLKAIVSMVAQRANERLLLTRNEYRELQGNLWNSLASVIKETISPLSADRR